MNREKPSLKTLFLRVFAILSGLIASACICLQTAYVLADDIKCWHPDYGKYDLSEILAKNVLSDVDYEILYGQTGLTRVGIDRMLGHGQEGVDRIERVQNDYFKNYAVSGKTFAPFTGTNVIDGNVTHVYLENGDIVVTSSTHLSGWRIGHAGLVVDSERNRVLQAGAIGELSAIGSVSAFTHRVNFMILSPKTESCVKARVAEFAENSLTGKAYNPVAGILSSKYKAESTQCAHLIWYAYNQFGIDLDGNGGFLVTPKDIANSPSVELVQVFGLEPAKLWK